MKWITREHVKVDRVACPWLIKKFVDKRRGVRLRSARQGHRGGETSRRYSLRREGCRIRASRQGVLV